MNVNIEDSIKELYGSKASFYEAMGIDKTNGHRLFKKYERWVNEINEVLEKLGLELIIRNKK